MGKRRIEISSSAFNMIRREKQRLIKLKSQGRIKKRIDDAYTLDYMLRKNVR